MGLWTGKHITSGGGYFKSQLPPADRERFDQLTNKNDSELQRIREQDYEVMAPYFDTQRAVFRSFSAEEQVIIQGYLEADAASSTCTTP